MYVHSVKLINYKSFGDYKENEVIIEPRITAIVGKNESGKSNVLDGLSQIRFGIRNNAAFNQDNIRCRQELCGVCRLWLNEVSQQ